jgi:hypothetical protein
MNEGPVVACYQFGAEAGDDDLGILVKKKKTNSWEEYVKLKTKEMLKKKEMIAWKEIVV